MECWSTAPSPNCTPRPRGWGCYQGGGSLPIPDSTDSGHRRGLTQAHIAIVLHVILQPRGNTRAALASGESSHCGGSILIVRIFLGVSIILGIPVRLVAIRVTKFVEKEGERERKAPAHISGFGRMYRAKQGAKTEKENRNFFHRAQVQGSLAQAGQKGKHSRSSGFAGKSK
jgi:hypothetical protein